MSDAKRIGNILSEGHVRREWIDVNGHMNVAYYILALDAGTDVLWDQFGITDDYIAATNQSTFAVECHVTYQKELLEGDGFITTAQVLAFDDKRIHHFQRMYHAEENHLVATAEWMALCVDLDTRRVCAWPDNILANMRTYANQQSSVDFPEEAGRQMSIAKPVFSL